MLAAAALVVVARAKPWGQIAPDERGSTSGPATTAGLAGPSAAPRSAVDGAGFYPQCYPSPNWRLAALQRTASEVIRTVWPVETPADPHAPVRDAPRLFGGNVEGIGYCVPGEAALARLAQATSVSIWRRASDGRLMLVNGTRVIDPELAAEGEVYLAPPTSIAHAGTWPAGDYFFEVNPAGQPATQRWFALQVVPSPTPTTTPAATPTRLPTPLPSPTTPAG